MTLLWCEGFDTKMAGVSGAYLMAYNYYSIVAYQPGRVSGFAVSSSSTNSGFMCYRTFGAQSEIIVGFAFKIGSSNPASGTAGFLPFMSGSTPVAFLACDAPTGIVSFRRGNPTSTGGTIVASAPTIPNDSTTWTYIEVRVKPSLTVGEVQFSVNGVLQTAVTGQNTGSATIDGVGFGSLGAGSNPDYSASGLRLDDMYCINTTPATANNTWLGDVRVVGLSPTSAGTNTQLTGTPTPNWDAVNDAPPTTTEYVSSPTAGLIDSYNYADLVGGGVVKGVVINSYANKSDAGQISGRNYAKVGANTSTGPDVVLSVSPQVFTTVLENPPGGSTGWAINDVNNAEFGWEVRA